MSFTGGHQYVTTGDIIPTEPGYLRGHGTHVAVNEAGHEDLVASVSGNFVLAVP